MGRGYSIRGAGGQGRSAAIEPQHPNCDTMQDESKIIFLSAMTRSILMQILAKCIGSMYRMRVYDSKMKFDDSQSGALMDCVQKVVMTVMVTDGERGYRSAGKEMPKASS